MPTRRNVIAAGISALARGAPARRRPPNILFLLTDQHARFASGIYGNQEAKTPHLDALGARAARFDRAYCQAPVCVPSRASLITSLYPHRHNAKVLQDALSEDIPTIGHFFGERGYVTGAIGAMHFVDETRRHGFHHRVHEGDFIETLAGEERRRLREDQGGAESVTGRASTLGARYFQDNFFADQSAAFLRENRNRPFLLFSSFVLPHTPLIPQREFFDLYRDKKLRLPSRSDHELKDGFPGNLERARERGWYQQSDEN